MAQYVVYNPDTYVEYTDGVDTFRQGSRGGEFVTDRVLTSNGFNGTINVDWENLDSITCVGATGIFRDGVRGGNFVTDAAITVTGFSGTINTDWKNLDSFPL
jgi:hypothetical protein